MGIFPDCNSCGTLREIESLQDLTYQGGYNCYGSYTC